MFKAKTLAAGITAVALSFSAVTAAQASTLTFNNFETNPAETVDISATAEGKSFENLRAGGFSMSDGVESFVAWCIDLFQTIKTAEYTVNQPSQVSATEAADINRLFTQQRATAQDSAVNSAAFQVALWEIVYETDASYSLAGGNFTASDNMQVVGLAQSYLDNLGSAPGTFDLTFYESTTSQDLVSGVSAVPLPASALLLLAGIGGLAATRRRKS